MLAIVRQKGAAIGLLIAVLFAIYGAASPVAAAQSSLVVELFENPFVCDGSVRPIGTVSGLLPNEQAEFSSPELFGLFSERVADGSGRIAIRWQCSEIKTWSVTVIGLSSGASATFTITGGVAPPAPQAPAGAAFDAKSAMTAQEMAIWKDLSPYNTVGVYIAVNQDWDNRADKDQLNLTSGWVGSVLADGWRLLPIYVGRQAPSACQTANFEPIAADSATARSQGFEAGQDAINSLRSLGIGAGSPVYYDMEGYRPGCADAVLAFLDGWTESLHSNGYLSGVYGSRSSAMWDLSRTVGSSGFDAPDAVWISTGNGNPTTLGLEVPPDHLWPHARIHQYRLSVVRTYGGVTREVDDNIIDAAAVRAAPPAPPPTPTTPAIVDSDGDGHGEPEPDNCDRNANPDQADLDGDGDGDVCDVDIDGDGVINDVDIAPNDATVGLAPTATPAPATSTPVPSTPIPATPAPATATSVPATPAPALPTAVPAVTPEALLTPPPSPTVQASPTPAPTATPPPGNVEVSSLTGEFTTNTVTITVEEDQTVLRWTIGVVALLGVGCGAMAVRGFRRRR